MKQKDELEQLFSSTFGKEKVVPPSSVKAGIDGAVFSKAGVVAGKGIVAKLISTPVIVTTSVIGVGTTLTVLTVTGVFSDDSNQYAQPKQERVELPLASEADSKLAEEETLKIDLAETTQSTDNGESSLSIDLNSGMRESQADLDHSLAIQERTAVPREEAIERSNIQRSVSETNSVELSTALENHVSSNVETLETTVTENENLNEEVSTPVETSNQTIPTPVEEDLAHLEGQFEELSQSNTRVEDISFEGEHITSLDQLDVLELTTSLGAEQAPMSFTKIKKGADFNLPRTPIEISMYGGVYSASNVLTTGVIPTMPLEYSIKERDGFFTSLEVAGSYKGIGWGTGFEFSRRTERFQHGDYTLVDTSFMVLDRTAEIQTTAYTLPLYFRFKQRIGITGLRAIVSAGVNVSYLEHNVLNVDEGFSMPSFQQVSASALIRPEIRYGYRRYEIGAYARFGYNFATGTIWDGHQRNRVSIGTGISLGYSF